ncbi:ParB/RepB/Spo0J family partition protein [Desulfitispora alkaliphila]|uniref:ParB/RepB/Spo0J family partition protein n=1 Tax=Desulfitispora alkaliphila TaxID=622674 RepID=UPI003D239E7A
MRIRKIPIKLIIEENKYRNKVEDKSLILSIREKGLMEPLIVEGPVLKYKYLLIEGYRRLASLKILGYKTIPCVVKDVSSEESRILKRLTVEFSTKKKTSYELERMMEFLINKGYTKKQIAKEINVSISTIYRYTKTIGKETEIKRKAEAAGVDKSGIDDIINIPDITPELREQLYLWYIDKLFKAYHVRSIKLITKTQYFNSLPTESQHSCIWKAINDTKFEKDKAKRIVFLETIKHFTEEDLNKYIFGYVIDSLKEINEVCENQDFINSLTVEQTKKISRILEEIQLKASNLKETNTPYQNQENDNVIKNIKFLI